MIRKAKKRGRVPIDGLTRANITITRQDRLFLEQLAGGCGLVAGIRIAIKLLKESRK